MLQKADLNTRAYALQRDRPLTLQATINLPTLADDPTDSHAHHLNSFILLANLCQPFDNAFVAKWNETRSKWPAAHLLNLQKQLADILPSFLNYGDSQLADLQTNQQWIKNMTWQLNNGSGEESMLYQQYAANLSTSLFSGASGLQGTEMQPAAMVCPSESLIPNSSKKANSGDQLTKLFDVACTLTEVLALHPASRDPFSPGPREQLNPLLNILSMLRNGDHRFMPLLLIKVHEVLPKLANPMLQNVPDSVANNACNVDIFDGFGNAGMAQPPVMMDNCFEKKYTSPESSGSQAGGSSAGNEMHSPFASSPMSPAGDFHGLPNNSFNPLSEVMMNQMGQSTAAPVPASNPPPTPQAHHQAHAPMTPMPTLVSPHMQNGMTTSLKLEQPPSNLAMNHSSQSFGQAFNPGMASYAMNALGQTNTNMSMPRQPPNRANSFAMAPNSQQIRTIGDFQALQRTNSNMSAMSPMDGMAQGMPAGGEMNFGGLR